MDTIKLTYPSDEDLRIPVYVYKPLRSLSSHPIAIGFHGGMFVMASAMHIPRTQVSWLRRAGFLVVAPEYRLCPHVGVWTGPVQDCVHLYNWVVSGGLQDGLRQFGITVDVDRISLFGHSVGATLAMVMSYTVTPPPKAVLSFYPCLQFTAPWTGPQRQLRTMPDFPRGLIALAYAHKLSDPNPDIKKYPDGQIDWGMDPHSPRVGYYLQNAKDGTLWNKLLPGESRRWVDPYLHRTSVPTFIIHGTEDYNVPVSVSQGMIRQLQSWGVECGLVEAPGQGHAFDYLTEESAREWEYIQPGLDFLRRKAFQNEQ